MIHEELIAELDRLSTSNETGFTYETEHFEEWHFSMVTIRTKKDLYLGRIQLHGLQMFSGRGETIITFTVKYK